MIGWSVGVLWFTAVSVHTPPAVEARLSPGWENCSHARAADSATQPTVTNVALGATGTTLVHIYKREQMTTCQGVLSAAAGCRALRNAPTGKRRLPSE